MPKKKQESNGVKILIVEDTVPLADVMKRKLEDSGYEATIVEDGVKAMKEIETGKYNLMLLDLVMPHMDGFTVLEKLKKMKSPLPVIVATNLGQPEDEERVKGLGAKDYIIKADVPLTEIVERVRKVV